MCSGAAKKHQGCFKFGVRIVCSFLFVLFAKMSANAQSVNVEITHFSSEEGLNMPMVNDLLLDGEGYLWLATLGGLARFDGSNFSNIELPDIESKTINFSCLAFDEKGNLWTVGTDDRLSNQLFKLNKGDSQLQPLSPNIKSGLPSDVRSLVPVSAGKFYMVTEREEVYQYNGGEISFLFQTPNQIAIRNLRQDAGELLIMVANKDIYRVTLDRGSNQHVEKSNGSIYQPPADFPTWQDFQTVSTKPFRYFSDVPSLMKYPKQNFSEAAWFFHRQDTPDVFWVLRKKQIHLFASQTNTWNDLSHLLEEFPKAQGIKCSLIDQYNQLWIGTNDGIFAIKAFISVAESIFDGRDHLGNAFSFRGITKWKGKIYANSYSGKVRYDPISGKESYFFRPEENGHLLAAHTGLSGDLLMGNGRYLQRYTDPETPPRSYNLPLLPDIPSHALEIWEIYEDNTGAVWLGTSVGLAIWEAKEEKVKYLPDPRIEHPRDAGRIHHILPIKDGLALASSNGFSYYDFDSGFNSKNDKYRKLISQTSGIPVYHICLDELGNIWLATHGKGLLQWDIENGSLHQYGSAVGFSDENLHAVYPDEHGGLWIPSESGLFLFDKADKRAVNIPTKFGFSEKEYNRIAHYRDENGNLYFGGIAGISYFHPSEYYESVPKYSAPIHWQSVKLSLGGDAPVREISSFIKGEDVIPLLTTNSTVEIELANLGNFETFEYKWKSNGDTWKRTNGPQITIQNLPDRPDELLIRAFGEFGLVSEILSIPFYWEYKNPWNKYLPYIMIAAAVLLMAYYFFGIRQGKGFVISPLIAQGTDEDNNPNKGFVEPTDEFETKLDAVILDHISTPEFGVNELSEVFCTSRKSLYRKIKQYTGQNPNEYIRNFRLEYARKLLGNADLNISDVTFKAGFSSSSYFSNCYKKHFGLSPKEDRKRLYVG